MACSAPLDGKVIVVIGGTTGLGLSAARAFVSAGARVAVVGRRSQNVAAAVSVLGETARGEIGDASEPGTAPRVIAVALEAFGRVDGLYHVAGGSGRSMGDGPLHELTDEGIDATLRLNLTSLVYSNRAAVRHFLQAGHAGAILNMGSVLGSSPSPRHFATHAYAAAKSAVIGFTKSVASYYATHGIRANVLAPALVETPMARRAAGDQSIRNFIKTKQPLEGGRIGCPEDCDGAAVFLLSDAACYVTGQVLAVDGGWSVSEGQVTTTG